VKPVSCLVIIVYLFSFVAFMQLSHDNLQNLVELAEPEVTPEREAG